MQKLLMLIMLLFTSITFTQEYAHVSNPVTEVVIFKGSDADGLENALTVPEVGFITFTHAYDYGGVWKFMGPNNEDFHGNNISESTTALALWI